MSLFKTNTNYYSVKDQRCAICSKPTSINDHFLFADQKDSPLCTSCYIRKKGKINYENESATKDLIKLSLVLLPFILLFSFFIGLTIIDHFINQSITIEYLVSLGFVFGALFSIIGLFFYLSSYYGSFLYYINKIPRNDINWKERSERGYLNFSSELCYYDQNKPTNRCFYCEQMICQDHSYIFLPRRKQPHIIINKENRSNLHRRITQRKMELDVGPSEKIDKDKTGYIVCKKCYYEVDLLDMNRYNRFTNIEKFFFGSLGLFLLSLIFDIILHLDAISNILTEIIIILVIIWSFKRFFTYKKKLKKYIEYFRLNQHYCEYCGNNLAFEGEQCNICLQFY